MNLPYLGADVAQWVARLTVGTMAICWNSLEVDIRVSIDLGYQADSALLNTRTFPGR